MEVTGSEKVKRLRGHGVGHPNGFQGANGV